MVLSHRTRVELTLGMVPERRDGRPMFWKRNRESISFVLLDHEGERVERDLAREPDFRLNAPVPFELIKNRLAEEVPRVKAAHIAVAHAPNVRHLRVIRFHLFQVMIVLALINPHRRVPLLVADHSEADLRTREIAHLLLELVGEWHLVEERPRIIVLMVERCLELAHRYLDTRELTVAREYEECCVGAAGYRVDGRVNSDINRCIRPSGLIRFELSEVMDLQVFATLRMPGQKKLN